MHGGSRVLPAPRSTSARRNSSVNCAGRAASRIAFHTGGYVTSLGEFLLSLLVFALAVCLLLWQSFDLEFLAQVLCSCARIPMNCVRISGRAVMGLVGARKAIDNDVISE